MEGLEMDASASSCVPGGSYNLQNYPPPGGHRGIPGSSQLPLNDPQNPMNWELQTPLQGEAASSGPAPYNLTNILFSPPSTQFQNQCPYVAIHPNSYQTQGESEATASSPPGTASSKAPSLPSPPPVLLQEERRKRRRQSIEQQSQHTLLHHPTKKMKIGPGRGFS